MAIASWSLVRVYGTWIDAKGNMLSGTYKISVPARLTNSTDDLIIPAGTYDSGALNTTPGVPSLSVLCPSTDDPDIQQDNWKLTVEVTLNGGRAAEKYVIDVPMANRPTVDGGSGIGVNLRTIMLAANTPPQVAMYGVGVPGGLAILSNDGTAVLDKDGSPIAGGGGGGGATTVDELTDASTVGKAVVKAIDAAAARSAIGAVADNDARLSDSRPPTAHNHPAAQISDSTSIGRAVVTATDAAAARTAIGAGTSNLALGSTGSTAAPGSHTHTSVQITDLTTTIDASVATVASELGDEAVARTAFGSQAGAILSPWKPSPPLGRELWATSNFTLTGSGNNTSLAAFTAVPPATEYRTNVVLPAAVQNGDTAFRIEFDWAQATTGWWSVSIGMVGPAGTVSRTQTLLNESAPANGHCIFEFKPLDANEGGYLRVRVVHENNGAGGDTITVNNISLVEVGRVSPPLFYVDDTASGDAPAAVGAFISNPAGVRGLARWGASGTPGEVWGYRGWNPFSSQRPDPDMTASGTAGDSTATAGATQLRYSNNDQILNVQLSGGSFELRGNVHGGETTVSQAYAVDRGDGSWVAWTPPGGQPGRWMKQARRFRADWVSALTRTGDGAPFATVSHRQTFFPDGVMRMDRTTHFNVATVVADYFEWMTSHAPNRLWLGRLGKAGTVIGECDTSVRLVPPTLTAAPSASGGTLPAGAKSYRITVLSGRGESTPTAAISATTTGTTGSVALTWAAVSGAAGYRIYGRTEGYETLLATVGTVTTWTDTGAAPPLGDLPPRANRASTTTPYDKANVIAHDATWAAWLDPAAGMCFGNIFDRDAAHAYPGVSAVKARIEQAPGITKNYQNLYWTGGATNTFTAGTDLTATHWSMVWIPESREDWHREIAARAANLNALKVMYPSS